MMRFGYNNLMTLSSLKKKITPYILEAFLSEQFQLFKRKLFELKIALLPWQDEMTFYHRLNDPYSFLLLISVMQLPEKFRLKVNLELVFELPKDLNPESKKLAKYALKDANNLIVHQQLNIPKLKKIPTRRDTFQATSCLLKQKPTGNNKTKRLHFLQLVSEVSGTVWGQSSTTLESCINRYGCLTETQAKSKLDSSVSKLMANGHYMSAMIHYGGEWYWGIDRFEYLTQRLNQAEVKHPPLSSYSENYLSLTLKLPTQKYTVDFYFSFRSPYSYLAAEQLFKMASQQQFDINIKPVLPMVMRGFQIPKSKRLYIVKDAKREALKNGIAFGRISDPLGVGIERCLALFPFAKSEAKERAFVSSIATGIWAEGVDVSTDEGLQPLVTRAGLEWEIAKQWLDKSDWRESVENNRNDLDKLGLWGVPSFTCDKEYIWGQDRLWLIHKAMQKHH